MFITRWVHRKTPRGLPYWEHMAPPTKGADKVLCGWPTPISQDASGSQYCYSQGDHSKRVLKLPGAAQQYPLAGWPTVTCSHANTNQSVGLTDKLLSTRDRKSGDLIETAVLAQHGHPQAPSRGNCTPNKGYKLNPLFACRLMGFPAEWLDCSAYAHAHWSTYHKFSCLQ